MYVESGRGSIHYAAAANVRNLSEYACASLFDLTTARIVCGVQSYDWSQDPARLKTSLIVQCAVGFRVISSLFFKMQMLCFGVLNFKFHVLQ